MQTLKTSAIVVLLMTVLFGAYTSMTTPPEPLPSGVGSMLVDSELDFGNGLPDDFGDFGIDTGTVAGADEAFAASSGTSDIAKSEPLGGGPLAGSAKTPPSSSPGDPMNFSPVDKSFADLESNLESASPSFQMSDLDQPPAGTRMSRLPDVGSAGPATVALETGRDYPSTGAAFDLPDPNEAISMTQDDLASPTSLGGLNQTAAADAAAAGLANAIATADRQYASDRRREALATLSLFYETPNLTSEQREQLLTRLDPLARDVIYSSEHLLEQPHRVGPSETLMDVAEQYDVPWQLLANINGVTDPVTVLPGTDLKVLRGPFRADVDLTNQELTLFLGDLYAGRFPVGIGKDPTPRMGTYTIQEKQSAKTYYDMNGTPVPPGNPRNPYGSMWIDLGSGISLHGSPKADQVTDQGCISVAGNYSQDVFGILSEGSSVTIR